MTSTNLHEDRTFCTKYVQLAFILSSLSIFLGGLFLIVAARVAKYAYKFISKCILSTKGEQKQRAQWLPKMRQISIRWKGAFLESVEMMLSAQTCVGRVLVILVFLLSIGSLIIYFINCAFPVEHYFTDHTLSIDMSFNAFFLFYFGLRFMAANNKLRFWLELNSIVDFFTIPPICVAYYLKRNWLGLRFLRALRLLELPKILQFLKITRTSNSIKLSKLLAAVLSTWLTAAGFIHLVENSGDPWVHHQNSQSLSYFDCLYLTMVTMSTVGFGDVVTKTSLGRIFMIFFIIAGLVLFANFIPEIVDIVGGNQQYRDSYEVVRGRKYIVVCGDITLESVTAFLRNFLAQDTGDICTEIVFLGETLPSLELETVFKCYSAYTTFFHGSALNYKDLKRVAMGSADACLILADTCSSDPYVEDTSNIMRALSVKNHYPKMRVIIQIIQSHKKVYLANIPSWDWSRGDSIICLSELKLGFIAQSCLVPGLSTLLRSLFIRQKSTKVKRKGLQHRNVFDGNDYKVMTHWLSNDFVDMTFPDVCRFCFVKLDLVLLAIEFRSGVHENSILVNPSAQIKIHRNTMGFFIAKSKVEVKRAHFYCKACHSDIDNPELIKKCHCRSKSRTRSFSECCEDKKVQDYEMIRQLHKLKIPQETLYLPDREPVKSMSLGVLPISGITPRTAALVIEEDRNALLDSTGMFHWCEAVPLEQAILHQGQTTSPLHDHIVVCVFGDANSTLIGLRNFVMPLRASNFTYQELKDIVFVGSLEYMKREWKFIQNFPKLLLFPGSALSCADLRAVNIRYCTMCTILSSNLRASTNPTLVDTESILATLNIRSMQFKCSSTAGEAVGRVRTLENESQPSYKRIPVITELNATSNVQFIDHNISSTSHIPGQELDLTTTFSSEAIFSDSFLDSLLSTTYRNHHILALLQTLVTGGTNPELEEQLAEKNMLSGSFNSMAYVAPRARCKLALVPLSKRLLTDSRDSFGDIYCKALDLFGILCFGLYRLTEESNPHRNRYAIARPPNDFKMLPTDMLFCVVPFGTTATSDLSVCEDLSPRRHQNHMVSSRKQNDVIL
ncbi:potassium channel subfamily U member 1 isoform X2 [Mauremys reevesii]|uniref:potassium channel subfamily U member 1 isoform X2 n=1 Tax=Mauremys reevesii TaxID=260615 RepID=UPI00193F0E7B|nr:potassium channel subfamily U member 1 isoform X2 [Mauremys reevesii]